MNLRHIDPGSTDWMDAMLEGELEQSRKREPERPKADGSHESPDLMAGGSSASPESIEASPREAPR